MIDYLLALADDLQQLGLILTLYVTIPILLIWITARVILILGGIFLGQGRD